MTEKFNILAIDDSIDVLDTFEIILENMDGCRYFKAPNLRLLDKIISDKKMNLIFIDVVMPKKDGYTLCKELREHPNTKDAYYFIMSSDKNNLIDRVKAFKIGANEFLIKPFDIKELELIILSKIEYFNRSNKLNKNSLEGLFQLDQSKKIIRKSNKILELSHLEYKCLEYMIINPLIIIDKQEMINYIWGTDDDKGNESLRHLIYRLRSKIEETPKDPKFIVSQSNEYIFYSSGNSIN